MIDRASGQRGDWVLDGELVDRARYGGRGVSWERSWHWVKERSATPCATCGHDRLHHLGFHEPGCSYLGTCSCPAFQIASEKTA